MKKLAFLLIIYVLIFGGGVAVAQEAAMAPGPTVEAAEAQVATIEKAPLEARLEALRTDLRKTNDDIQLLVNRRLMLLGAIEVLNEALK